MPRSQQKQSTKLPAVVPKPSVPTVSSPQAPQAGFGQLIKEGIGFGIGQSIAHRAVSAILGPSVPTGAIHPTTPTASQTKDSCFAERATLDHCLRTKTQEDHCNYEDLAYVQCLELNKKSQ